MRKSIEVINELKNTSSSNEKKKIIQEKFDDDLHVIFDAACNTMIYNFKKLKEEPSFSETDSENSLDAFIAILRKLSAREITGNKAQEAMHDFISSNATKEAWETIFFPILKKDMRCGVSRTLYNNAVSKSEGSDNVIYTWSPMGAISSERDKDFIGIKYVEPKHDGVRVCMFYDHLSGKMRVVSRNNKEYRNFDSIASKVLEKGYSFSFMLDGEIVSEDFQKLSTQLQRKEDVDCSDAVYHVFDFVTDAKRPLKLRKQDAENFCNDRPSPNIIYSGYEEHTLDKPQDAFAYYESIMKEYVARGFEGIVIKDPDSPYLYEKDKAWLKMKPSDSVDLPIASVIEGTGKYVGKVGALIVRGEDKGKVFEISVGSGLSDELRTDLWDKRNEIIGKMIEVKYDSITKSQSKEFYSVRFPRFVRFREDKEV